jgi:hypothetical protein
MARSNWEADKMLDVYIYDYLVKRNLHNSAKAFMNEGKVATDPVDEVKGTTDENPTITTAERPPAEKRSKSSVR